MSNRSQIALLILVILSDAVAASAANPPTNSELLRLVPDGAQVVSGISNPGTSSETGRLLVVTRNNNRDLDDCLALLGVDEDAAISEVIAVASSSTAGELEDHLLLVAGHFDRTRIFRSAFGRGSTGINYNGQELLEIRPFNRERRSKPDVRWMAILNNRVLVFGVPNLVATALTREERGQPEDPILLQRLGQFHPDVNSWSIISMPAPMLTRHLAFQIVPASLESILKDADEVALGIHYARRARIDFSIHAGGSDLGSRLFDNAQLILASLTRNTHSHLQVETDDQRRIHGSLTVQEKVFDQWLAAVEQRRSRIEESRTGEQ